MICSKCGQEKPMFRRQSNICKTCSNKNSKELSAQKLAQRKALQIQEPISIHEKQDHIRDLMTTYVPGIKVKVQTNKKEISMPKVAKVISNNQKCIVLQDLTRNWIRTSISIGDLTATDHAVRLEILK